MERTINIKKEWPIQLPSFDLRHQTALVTGGTKGIGYGIAMLLARCGANVVVSSRSQSDCERVAAQITGLGGSAVGIAADMKSINAIERLISETLTTFGKLDILVNNAGLAVTKKILDTQETDYDTVMETNLKSVYFMSKAATSCMKTQPNGGRIIQMASIGGLKGSSSLSCYGASKAAVINLTKTMALEWSRYNIQVNAVCPGYVMTDINKKEFENAHIREKTLKAIPQRRFGTVDEVAALVLFLASDASNMITGQAIVADMGATCG